MRKLPGWGLATPDWSQRPRKSTCPGVWPPQRGVQRNTPDVKRAHTLQSSRLGGCAAPEVIAVDGATGSPAQRDSCRWRTSAAPRFDEAVATTMRLRRTGQNLGRWESRSNAGGSICIRKLQDRGDYRLPGETCASGAGITAPRAVLEWKTGSSGRGRNRLPLAEPCLAQAGMQRIVSAERGVV